MSFHTVDQVITLFKLVAWVFAGQSKLFMTIVLIHRFVESDVIGSLLTGKGVIGEGVIGVPADASTPKRSPFRRWRLKNLACDARYQKNIFFDAPPPLQNVKVRPTPKPIYSSWQTKVLSTEIYRKQVSKYMGCKKWWGHFWPFLMSIPYSQWFLHILSCPFKGLKLVYVI